MNTVVLKIKNHVIDSLHTIVGWPVCCVRLLLSVLAIVAMVFAFMLARIAESVVFARTRAFSSAVSKRVTQLGMGFVVILCGVKTVQHGTPMAHKGMSIANHLSWLDILVLYAINPFCFVAKSDIKDWYYFGWWSNLIGVIFVDRTSRRTAMRDIAVVRERVLVGDPVLVFPEGTTTNGNQMARFKPTLLAALFDHNMPSDIYVQPISLYYAPSEKSEADLYMWWQADETLLTRALKVFRTLYGGRVIVMFHAPVQVCDYADRKALNADLYATIQNTIDQQTLSDCA